MNRRKMFSGLGLGAIATLFGAGKAKAEPLPIGNQYDVWVTTKCSLKVDDYGKYVSPPKVPSIVPSLEEFSIFDGDYSKTMKKKEEEYSIKYSEYKETKECGAVYRRIRGTSVHCPKCRIDSQVGDSGILVE